MSKKRYNGKLLSTGEIVSSLITMILLTIIYAVIFDMKMDKEYVVYCYNDVYCYAQCEGVIPLLMVSELYIIFNLKYEWRTNVLIREKSMRSFWIRIVKKIAVLSAAVTLYSFLVCSVYAGVTCVYGCNWLDKNSNAFDIFRRNMTVTIDTWIIQVIFLLVIFAEVSVMGMLIVISWWWLRQPVYGYGVVIAFANLETGRFFSNISIFFMRMTMANSYIYLKGYNVIDHILFPILMVVGTLVSGIVLFRKRDMLRKDSDV